MSSIALEGLLVLVLIVANGVFAGSELAILSARKVRLEQVAKQGDRRALTALKLANSPNQFLSAAQIGITLIGILSGAVGGATLAERLSAFLVSIPALAPYREPLSIGVVVSLITYLSLVIGELVPKRIAMHNPEAIACRVAPPMSWLTQLASPLVHVLSFSTDGLLNLLGIRDTSQTPVTEEEIKVLLQQGTEAGLFEVAEQEIVSRVFRLADRPIKAMMTPRVEIAWLDLEASPEENQQEIVDTPFSRYPVGQESIDHCVGIVAVKDLWMASRADKEFDLTEIMRTPLFVPENTPALDVLETFRETGNPMAMVTDEYGGIAGLVTLSDLLEAIVGTLQDANHSDEAEVVQREDGSFLIDGLLTIDELKEVLDRESLPLEETGQFHSLGGFVVTYLEHIPEAGEFF
jgi:putative hemolysin